MEAFQIIGYKRRQVRSYRPEAHPSRSPVGFCMGSNFLHHRWQSMFEKLCRWRPHTILVAAFRDPTPEYSDLEVKMGKGVFYDAGERLPVSIHGCRRGSLNQRPLIFTPFCRRHLHHATEESSCWPAAEQYSTVWPHRPESYAAARRSDRLRRFAGVFPRTPRVCCHAIVDQWAVTTCGRL